MSIAEVQAAKGQQYIIAIGASAGGLEVIHELFDSLPDNTGFSFVIIQHLSPDYKSLLAELLSKHTMMQVYEAQDKMELMPNCVYVIPSKKIMTVDGKFLRLEEKVKSVHPNNAVDVFFSSLGNDYKQNAVGIILSGTGSDGSKGIQEIKKNGGLVIVQDPATANFDGMPTNAIATGCVDLILPSDLIAEELISYLKDQPLYLNVLPGTFEGKDELIFREILNIIYKNTKYDFNYYKTPTLIRRLAKRMAEVNISDLEEYKDFILSNPAELKSLYNEFLINVTKFFRDLTAYEFLRSDVLPQIFSDKNDDDSIKVWSAGCSSGEEAYSLAILFYEYAHRVNKPNLNIKIFATDIDTTCLEKASRGIYSETIEKDVPVDLLKKHFKKEDKTYRVNPHIRKMVVFANHDVIKDPPFSKLDLVVCRNMLIYINTALQKKILRKFHFAMNINSFLFLGPSENIGSLKDVVEEKSRKWKIFKCTSKSLAGEKDFMMSSLLGKTSPINILTSKKNEPDLSELLKDSLVADRIIAGVAIDKDYNIKNAIGKFKHFFSLPEDTFHLNLLKLLQRDLSIALGVALRKSIDQNEPVMMKKIIIHENNIEKYVNLIVKHVTEYKSVSPFFFIVFEEYKDQVVAKKIISESISGDEKIEELEHELKNTRENLQAVIEEIETTNEELQSSNEEMISTNEELQSTNEELQSLNEELHTVSVEHQSKIKELIELNDDLDNSFRTSDTGQLFVDKNLCIKQFNHIATRVVNLISSDIGRSIVDITTNIRQFDLVNDIKFVIRTSTPVEKEVSIDEKAYYLIRVNPYVKRDNTVDGAVVTFIDITQSKSLSGIIEGIFNSTVNGITAKKAIRDDEGNIADFEFLAANESFAKMFNMKAKDVIGKSYKEVFADQHEMHFNAYKKVIETGQQVTFEYLNKSLRRWYESTIVKMFDGIVETHVDITDRKKAADIITSNFEELKKTTHQLRDSNDQLERSNLDLMQFASVASHDLKEPLRKIQTFGNILQSKLKDKLIDGDLNYLNKMISASGRMQTLIEDVLTLSKLSNGNYLFAQINLKKIVRRIIDDLEITIQEKKAKIIIGQMPDVYGIAGQLHQLFQNLISNSLKFSDKASPSILITQKDITTVNTRNILPKPEDFYCIQVIDNGIGFEEIYLDKIFGIFQRIHGRQFDGTGIGLAIAKKIVENHHGYISAESKLGEGATFSIFLPKENPQVNSN